MYSMLVRLMLVAALIEFGPKISDIDCRSRACVQKVEKKSRNVLKVD